MNVILDPKLLHEYAKAITTTEGQKAFQTIIGGGFGIISDTEETTQSLESIPALRDLREKYEGDDNLRIKIDRALIPWAHTVSVP